MPVESVGTPAMWAGFLVFVLAMLALDLGVFYRQAAAVVASVVREARSARGGPRSVPRSVG